jgi:protoheme IX farnesyltransferase
MHTFKQYYVLTKPGIIYGNLFAAIAGFFLASRGDVSITLFIATMLGLSCIIASACVCNNIMDRKIDAKMMRTKRRALATGIITPFQAIVYGAVLGLVGSAILIYFVNLLAWGVAILGWIGYVVVYGIAKRITSYATEIGSIPGAMPPVVGYSAMNRNQLPLIIPCHRVVASDGIGGFGCGLGWKKQLLAIEHVLI